MHVHDHSHRERNVESNANFWTSRAFLVCAAFLIIVGILLWTEHMAHALGYLPYLLLVACPLMHVFMHSGHGGHSHRPRTDRGQPNGDKP